MSTYCPKKYAAERCEEYGAELAEITQLLKLVDLPTFASRCDSASRYYRSLARDLQQESEAAQESEAE